MRYEFCRLSPNRTVPYRSPLSTFFSRDSPGNIYIYMCVCESVCGIDMKRVCGQEFDQGTTEMGHSPRSLEDMPRAGELDRLKCGLLILISRTREVCVCVLEGTAYLIRCLPTEGEATV